MPADLLTPGFEEQPQHRGNVFENYVSGLHKQLCEVFDAARANSLKAAEKRKRLLDNRMKPVSYSIGDKVWLRSSVVKPGNNAKWSAKLVGPFCIIKSVGTANFIIQKVGSSKRQLVHADRLKKDVGDSMQ